jgi:hypothetical protein
MEDSGTNLALLLEYARLLKSARELQLREIETLSFRALAISAETNVKTCAAAQEIVEFIRNPIAHPLTQVPDRPVYAMPEVHATSTTTLVQHLQEVQSRIVTVAATALARARILASPSVTTVELKTPLAQVWGLGASDAATRCEASVIALLQDASHSDAASRSTGSNDADVRTLSKIDLLERQLAEIKALLAAQQQAQQQPQCATPTAHEEAGGATPRSTGAASTASSAPVVAAGARRPLPRPSVAHALPAAAAAPTPPMPSAPGPLAAAATPPPSRPRMQDVLAAAKTLHLRKVTTPSDESRAAAANTGLSGALRVAMEKRFKVLVANRKGSSPDSDDSDSVFGSPDSDAKGPSAAAAAAGRPSLGKKSRQVNVRSSLAGRVAASANNRRSLGVGAGASGCLTAPLPHASLNTAAGSSGSVTASAKAAAADNDERVDASLALSSDSESEPRTQKTKGQATPKQPYVSRCIATETPTVPATPPPAQPAAVTEETRRPMPPAGFMSPAAMLGEVRSFNRTRLRKAPEDEAAEVVVPLSPSRKQAAGRFIGSPAGGKAPAGSGSAVKAGINAAAIQSVALRKTGVART